VVLSPKSLLVTVTNPLQELADVLVERGGRSGGKGDFCLMLKDVTGMMLELVDLESASEKVTWRWLCFTLLAGGVVCTLICWLALQFDFFRGTSAVFEQVFGIIWLCSLTLLCVGGLHRKLHISEDWIIALVLVWSTLIVLISAFCVQQIRLCVMVLFFAIVQAGVFRASRRLLIGLGVLAEVGYGVILLAVHMFFPTMVDWSAELVQWLAFTVVTAGAMFLAVDISTLRVSVVLRNRQLESIADQILDMAMHDELTGLCNRRHAMERLSKLRELAARGGPFLHIAYLDLDHFKRINDDYGHAVGDEVLHSFAKVLRVGLSGRDFAARIGGEEFLLVLVQHKDEEALAHLEFLRERWCSTRLPNHEDIRMTVSAGIAPFRLRESLTEWLARADAALYQAKALGRNRVCMASDQAGDICHE
jgi:diguanylate cyclase (GGDEF)-like protein